MTNVMSRRRRLRREIEELTEKHRDAIVQRDRRLAELKKLKRKRRTLITKLGEARGEHVNLVRVEKSYGHPSLVVAERAMQRVLAEAESLSAVWAELGQEFRDKESVEAVARDVGLTIASTFDEGSHRVLVHAFHGEVGLVEVRHGEQHSFVDPSGAVRTDVALANDPLPPASVPSVFAECVHLAELLSLRVPRPYVQIGFRIDDEVVRFHSLTIDPVLLPVLTTEWDRDMGKQFDFGHARFMKSISARGDFANVMGTHVAPTVGDAPHTAHQSTSERSDV